MPHFQIDVEKQLGQEFWTNVYHVTAADMADAISHGSDIVEIEQTVHTSDVNFTKFRASTMTEGDFVFATVPINEPGTNSTGPYLALFNVVRVDFGIEGFGRPCRKYLRCPILETQQTDGLLEDAMVTFINENYADLIVGLGFVENPHAVAFINGSTSKIVGMRQLRRGSKRRLAPVLP